MKRQKVDKDCWLLQRSPDHGGVSAFIVGGSRTGKTTFMVKLAKAILRNFPQEIVFWRGLESCQWTYFKPGRVRLLLSPFYMYQWVDLDLGQQVDVKQYVAEVVYCYSAEDFLKQAKPGYVNVIYMPDRMHLDLVNALCDRFNRQWISLFMDEVHEIVPENPGGDLWHWVKLYSDTVGQLAKRWVSYVCASQSYKQVSYMLRAHMQYWVFMPRAKKPRGESFRLWQQHIDSLSLGKCAIEGQAGYGDIEFDPVTHYAQLNVIITRRVQDAEETALKPAAAESVAGLL